MKKIKYFMKLINLRKKDIDGNVTRDKGFDKYTVNILHVYFLNVDY
jgi:hypothetical protein